MPSGGRLDTIRNEVPTLEGITHAERAHRDAVRYADCAELVAGYSGAGEGGFDEVAEGEDVFVAAASERRTSVSE